MEQSNSASFVSSPYPSMMDLPSAHMPFRHVSNGPATPDARQHSFDDTAYFSPGPQEFLNFPASRVAESSLDPWLMDLPGSATPDSSRTSMSPSLGMATPPSDAFYPSPYPEELHSPAYHLLEQPQPVRSDLTSHPNWANSGDNWERTYDENSLWSTQPFVAQPWIPTTYDGYAPSNTHASHAPMNQNPFPTCSFAAQGQFPVQAAVQTGVALAPPTDGHDEDADSSDDEDSDSDSDSDASDYTESSSHTSGSRRRANAQGSRVDRWAIPTGTIQQSTTRGYPCQVSECTTSFVRPEHLRRHIRCKHNPGPKEYACVVPGCNALFSRGDNLRDHYWTHLQRGGRNGKNKKFTLEEIRVILGPKEKRLFKRLREKLRLHQLKELKKQQRRPYAERSML